MTRTTARSTKAVVAGGLAIALLAGAGGTFATWESTQNYDAQAITAGHLTLTPGEDTWSDSAGTIDDIANYRIVPGSTITYTVPVHLDITGDNLRARFETTVDATIPENISDDGALTETVTVMKGDDVFANGEGEVSKELTAADTGDYTVIVDLALATSASSEWQRQTINLSNVTVGVSQITSS